jgi:hypothetical protein
MHVIYKKYISIFYIQFIHRPSQTFLLSADRFQIWVYGNSFESSLIAVINPNQQVLEHWAEQNGISGSLAELCENSRAKEHFIAELSKIAKEKKVKRLILHICHSLLVPHFISVSIYKCS